MKFKYALKEMNENMAKSMGRDLSISQKKAIEICNYLRGKNVVKAKSFLERVIAKESPVPMKKFNRDTGHKAGMAAGRYPVKTAMEVLKIVKSAEANAQNKGLSTKDMIIYHIVSNKASEPWHYGRKKRQKMKRTHLEVVLLEKKQEKTEKTKEAKK